MPAQLPSPHDPDGLEAYFTDVEHLRDAFAAAAAAESLPKRIFVIHGVGGVGKSSLLRMFWLHCKREGIPLALASGDGAKGVVKILEAWGDDLKQDKVKLPTFEKSLKHYQMIRAKVEEQASQAQEARGDAAANVGKVLTKTAVDMAASTIPVIGPIISTLGGAGAEAAIDWLRSFLGKPDVDLLLDPDKELTEDFLEDIAKDASKRRLVLLLDTFEQMTALEEWMRTLAYHLHPNLLLVVAGRAVPEWGRQWPGWLAHTRVEELRPMDAGVMRELVRRYYAMIRGGEPDPAQVEAIMTFARGLPIAVTSAVELWVRYGVEDFHAVKPQVVVNLVERLREGVPIELLPVLEAAASVRWFNQEILRAVTGRKDVSAGYEALRRFPFVQSRAEGLALHDTVREIIDESVAVQDPAQHRLLHEAAAAYFETRDKPDIEQETGYAYLEALYHRIRADEPTGIRRFQEIAQKLANYQFVNQLRELINEVSLYRLALPNSTLWHRYYQARLLHFEARFAEAERIYQSISEDERAESRLRGLALHSLGAITGRTRLIHQPSSLQTLLRVTERSNRFLGESDSERIANLINLGGAYYRLSEGDTALYYFEKALALFEQQEDRYGISSIYGSLVDVYAAQGNWKKMFHARQQGLNALPTGAKSSLRYAELAGSWGATWTLTGRYKEAEENTRIYLATQRRAGGIEIYDSLGDLGFSLALQGLYQQAEEYFSEAERKYREILVQEDTWVLAHHAAVLLREQRWSQAEEYLERGRSFAEDLRDQGNHPLLFYWWGLLHELREDWTRSSEYYRQCLDYRRNQRYYFECAALTGLVRVKHAQGDLNAILPLLTEAEALAQQYEYNDHLASLRLTQGHLAADPDTTLSYYQQVLIYALRYNRFLLDEVLSGRPQGTPLRPIIPACLELGEEGRDLLRALRDWWQSGVNDIGTSRPDTISPIPEGISLLEGERLARQREPGDGSPQRNVLAQLNAALGQ